ncbi:MAG TPA: cupin domain-containing protein [Bryobacteraceae bacterium]|nr:cupin domain-containing protein [Bryobacteraceae bacterium]
MSYQQHCDECFATAAMYALGALPPEERRGFEQRLAGGCPLCSAALEECAEITSMLAAGVPAEAPPASLRDRLLERIGHAAEPPKQPPPEMTLVRKGESPWRKALPGVEMRRLLGDKTLLVRMQPGTVYPEHEHPLDEQCYVLEGSITDSDGITAYAGDFVCMAAGSTHRPIHTKDGCLLLIAYA